MVQLPHPHRRPTLLKKATGQGAHNGQAASPKPPLCFLKFPERSTLSRFLAGSATELNERLPSIQCYRHLQSTWGIASIKDNFKEDLGPWPSDKDL